jgi:aryl-alcohol dehydrogenase-like predicted oxidoreductase
MNLTRNINGQDIPALGLGCWAIGGHFEIDGAAKGWGQVDDRQSIRSIHAAVADGIRFFDTAQAYGLGHSETLLGEAIGNRADILIGTKVGYAINPDTKQFVGEVTAPKAIADSIDASLRRLQRGHVDLVHLHLNELPVSEAAGVFDCLAHLRAQGKVRSFGWSTDFPDRASAFADRDGFISIQHALNVFFRADRLLPVIAHHGLLSINRSPLAMGLLSGKYDAASTFGKDDVRGHNEAWLSYFKDGRIEATHARRLSAVRDLLTTGGRTLVQGAICWNWARSRNTLPIPGFKTPEQVTELAGALQFGPLPKATMDEIERVIERQPEGEPHAR